MNPKTSEQWAIELGRNACDDPFCWNQAIAESMVDKIREQALREAAEAVSKLRWGWDGDCGAEKAILSLIDRKEGV